VIKNVGTALVRLRRTAAFYICSSRAIQRPIGLELDITSNVEI
jgi:hypothetical protein